MESLYVCLFSSGLIKVGRSSDPRSRIAAHADRVACAGIEMVNYQTLTCAGDVVARETWLIQRCADAGSQRFSNEWFDGLDYSTVCEWAKTAATMPIDADTNDSFGARLREARLAAGLSQSQFAATLGLGKGAISSWECNNNCPSALALRAICLSLGVSADSLLGLDKARA
jgi:DNA-binding XRE family transcriptional regulator